jgi:membrane protein implicated in regulation of membrane protease activity
MRTVTAVLLGIAAGALYTVSPLTAWCAALAAVVLTLAGRGLPAPERRALNILLIAALVVRLAAIGALFVINTPLHDDESVGMLAGDEAYGLSRALRTRDVMTGGPVGQYDYVVTSDEYGRNSYITLLTGIQVLFGPTPYSMRLLNTLLFCIAGILLFRTARSAFGPLPAFGGLAVLLFLPTLFYWSISLLKEPLYLLGTTLVVTGAIRSARAATWRERATPWIAALAGLAIVTDLRAAAFALTMLGLGCGIAALAFFSASPRVKATAAIAAVLLLFAVTSRPSAQQRIKSALESTAKAHAGHVFTVGHAYKLLDDAYYVNPVSAAASTLTLGGGEAARYVVRAAVSFVAVPLPWQLASTRELSYLPEQLIWYVMLALLPAGLAAGWRRDPIAASLLAGFVLPTAVALALTNGNVGTLLRLRGIVIPFLVWLSAVGFCAALQRLATSSASSTSSAGAATS